VGIKIPVGHEEVEGAFLFDVNGFSSFIAVYLAGLDRQFEDYVSVIHAFEWGKTRVLLHGNIVLPPPRYYACCSLRVDQKNDFDIQASFEGDGSQFSILKMPTSRRVFIYSESELRQDLKEKVRAFGESVGVLIQFRSESYRVARDKTDRIEAFICHDSGDKAVARGIAVGLGSIPCAVWYDEFSLRVGQSLRESIETGLKACKKCILIMSTNFIANAGWTKKEFTSIYTREIVEKKNLMLPVWVNVTREQVYHYCPSLADLMAIRWDESQRESICKKLFREIDAAEG
jgi:hypothetical protein